MDIKVTGKPKISGELSLSGSKNSAVALIPASILFDGKITFTNVPDITDVHRLVAILKKWEAKLFGVTIKWLLITAFCHLKI